MDDARRWIVRDGQRVGMRWPEHFPLRIMADHQQPDTGMHSHDFTELVLVRSGTGRHLTAAGAYRLHAGDCFLLHPGEQHAYRDTKKLGIVNILFDIDELALPLHELQDSPGYQALFAVEPSLRSHGLDSGRLRLQRHAMTRAHHLARDIAEIMELHEPGWRFAARAHCMQLLYHLCRMIDPVDQRCDAAMLRLAELLAWLDRHLTETHRLDALAERAGLSVNDLLRLFNQATGTSPIAWLLRRRMGLAVEFLRESEHSITDIAFSCGFTDSNYFSRQFRRLFGCSPRDWRRRHRAPAPSHSRGHRPPVS